MRNLIPVNWLVGTLALLVALFYPLFDQKVRVEALKRAVEGTVASIAKQQHEQLTRHHAYVQFGAGGEDQRTGFRQLTLLEPEEKSAFEYESFVEGNGVLVIRARASAARVRDGGLPPLIYEFRRRSGGGDEAKWIELSRKSRGLGLF